MRQSHSKVLPKAWRRGVYETIARRRDIRHFKPTPIPWGTLARILQAAHHAPSVGFMQPWNFIVVEDVEVRKKIQAHVEKERVKASEKFKGKRKEKYLSLKLEGILEAPINICVTCDPNRFGPAVIGRNTIRETDTFSTCCAVQNLWLAARAEGIGVGWVSILKPARLQKLLQIPKTVRPLAYLCLGYVDSFPEKPTLEKIGWLPRVSLRKLVYFNTWGASVTAAQGKYLQEEKT